MFGRKKKNSDLDWQPETISDAGDRDVQNASAAASASKNDNSDLWTGLIHPRSIIGFLGKNFRSMVTICLLTVLAGLAIYFVLPEKYSTKALILVDPRQPRITNSEAVLSGIGGDAAALTSYVQIMNSDGFLGKVVKELGVADDPAFAKAKNSQELINMFRSSLSADRQGATYIVEVYYKSKSPEKAAKYANGVAEAFVRDQKDYRTETSVEAADWLSERLDLLKANLKKSEDAVASFQARNGIVDGGAQGTLDNQRLASLVTQLGAATTELAEARARFQQASKDGVPASANSTQTGQFTNLDQLLQEQDRLRRQAAELNQTLGSRHPRVLANAEQQRIIAAQISEERSRLVLRTKQAYQTAEAKKIAIERQLADARQRSIELNKAMVELATLQREASANRNLYEQFLERFKITDEQSQFQFNEARIVSPANVPVKSNKPSLALVAPVLAILGFVLGFMVALVREAFAAPPSAAQYEARETASYADSHLDRPVEHFLERDEQTPAPEQTSPETDTALAQAESEDNDLLSQMDELKLPRKRNVAQDRLEAPEEDETVVRLDRQPASKRSARAERAAAANRARNGGRSSSASLKSNEAILLTLPARREQDFETVLDDLISDHHETLLQFTNGHRDAEPVCVLVTAAQPGEGQDLTSDLVREFAIDQGFHPVVISLQDRSGRSQKASVQNGRRPTDRVARLQEFEAFDLIPFATANGISSQGLSSGLTTQLGNMIDVCKDNYGFVILETRQILDPETLEDLIDLVDASLMVLENRALSAPDLADWQDWATSAGVGLVLDQTES